jgi:KDEL-tailed cysteine endopeptidase
MCSQAFQYIRDNGLATSADYPFIGTDGSCYNSSLPHMCRIAGWESVPSDNNDELLHAVAGQPVAVAIDADATSFQFYSSGLYVGSACSSNVNHGVVLVGFGNSSSADGNFYWKLKNSWGSGEYNVFRFIFQRS